MSVRKQGEEDSTGQKEIWTFLERDNICNDAYYQNSIF